VIANLVIRSGPMKGQRIPIRVPIVNLGRADYNDVMLSDDSVSTSHAKLQRREGVWVLVDLESTNGSFVDGERVRGEAPIAPGALLRFGDVQAMFEPTDDTVDAAKGSSTKLISAVQLPAPPPAAAPPPAPREPNAPPAPPTPSAAAPAPKPGPVVGTVPERPAVTPPAAAAPPPRRPAPRPRPAAPSRRARGGLPRWVILAAAAIVLGLVIAFLLLR
jgi:adenylate cyclase